MNENQDQRKGIVILWLLICLVGALSIIGGIGLSFFKQQTEKRLTSTLQVNGINYQKLAVDWLGHYQIQGLKSQLGDNWSLRADLFEGDISFFSSTSNNITLNNLELSDGNARLSIPTLTIKQAETNFTPQKNNALPLLLQSLIHIKAVDVKAPQMVYAQKYAEQNFSLTYFNIVLSEINEGLIRNMVADHSAVTFNPVIAPQQVSSPQQVPIVIYTGHADYNDLNLQNMVAFYSEKISGDYNPYMKMQGAFSVKDITYTLKLDTQGEEVSFNLGEISGAGFSAKLLPYSYNALMKDIQKAVDANKLDSLKQAEMSLKMLEVFRAIGPFDYQIKNMVMQSTTTNNKTIMRFDNGRFAYDDNGFDFSVKNFSVSQGDQIARFDEFSIDDISYPALFKTLHSAIVYLGNHGFDDTKPSAGQGNESFEKIQAQLGFALIPHFRNIRMKGIEIHPGQVFEGQTAPIPLTLDLVDITADFSRKSIPTALRIDIQKLHIPAFDFSDPSLAQADPKATFPQSFSELGYQFVDIDMMFDAKWDAESKTLLLNKLSYKAHDMLQFDINARFNNVTHSLFEEDPMSITFALMSAKIDNVELSYNSDGLRSHYATWAQKHNIDVNALYQTASQNVTTVLKALSASLDPHIALAFDDNIKNGGTMTLRAKAKSAQGLQLLDFIRIQENPLLFFEKVDLKAETAH